MSINLKYVFGLVIFLFLNNLVAISQYANGGDYNPEKLLAQSKDLEEKAHLALTRASLYQQEGSVFLDSALFFNSKLKTNLSADNYRLCMSQLESNYTIAYKYIAMADSMSILAQNFREQSLSKTKEAYAMMGKVVEVNDNNKIIQPIDNQTNTSNFMASSTTKVANVSSSRPIVSNKRDETISQNTSFFIVQLGAGNMDMNYFKKVPDIKIVSCKDGIKRYVLPGHFSKTEAAKKKEELMGLGYEQVFIRTEESLAKISK